MHQFGYIVIHIVVRQRQSSCFPHCLWFILPLPSAEPIDSTELFLSTSGQWPCNINRENVNMTHEVVPSVILTLMQMSHQKGASSIFSLIDIQVVSTSRLWEIMLKWTREFKYRFEILFSFLLDKYPEVRLVDYK